MTRINALTGIRAVAAIMVFLYHNRKFWRSDISDFPLRLLNEFHTGVSLFFVLSGFLIAYTYKDKAMESPISYVKYFLIRVARIFPVYLIILSLKYIDLGFPSLKESLLTYGLFQGFSSRYNLSGIPQAWSLTVELSFYVLAPIIYYLLKRNFVKMLGFLFLLLGLSFLVGYGLHFMNANRDGILYDWHFIFNTTFFGRFMEFLCGMLLAHWIQEQNGITRFRFRYFTIAGGMATVGIIYLIGLFEKNIYAHGTDVPAGLVIRNFFFPIAVAIFFYGLIKEKTWLQWLLSTKLMVLLGNASFIFYLVHINYVNSKLWAWQQFSDRNFILLWVVSIFIYLLVERPVYDTLKRWIKREPRKSINDKFLFKRLTVLRNYFYKI